MPLRSLCTFVLVLERSNLGHDSVIIELLNYSFKWKVLFRSFVCLFVCLFVPLSVMLETFVWRYSTQYFLCKLSHENDFANPTPTQPTTPPYHTNSMVAFGNLNNNNNNININNKSSHKECELNFNWPQQTPIWTATKIKTTTTISTMTTLTTKQPWNNGIVKSL